MRRRSAADRLVARYLADVDRALASLPRDRRRQIVDEIAAHVAEERAELAHERPTAIRALLARVGEPRAIAAEAGVAAADSRLTRQADPLVPWLLLLGGFLFLVGWLVGVVLLWASSTWRTADKVLGTLVLPGGLVFAFALLGLPAGGGNCTGSGGLGQPATTHCTTSGFVLPFPLGLLVLAVALLAPILTAVHLQRARQRALRSDWGLAAP